MLESQIKQLRESGGVAASTERFDSPAPTSSDRHGHPLPGSDSATFEVLHLSPHTGDLTYMGSTSVLRGPSEGSGLFSGEHNILGPD